MKKLNLLPYIVLLAALAVSGVAAYYSIFGLSKLFAGAAFEVIIMASALEFAKLVIASLLQREGKNLDLLRRSYLIISLAVLIVITSAGIYGFLSNAYQITANKDSILQSKLNVLELKKTRYTDQRNEIKLEQAQVIGNITELRKSLSNPSVIQYIDPKTKQVISTTSAGARKSLESQLQDAISRRDLLGRSVESASDSIAYYEVAIIDAKSSSSVSSELGPLKYLQNLTGKSMDSTINWFLLLIMFVFDPLAIILLTIANYLLMRNSKIPPVVEQQTTIIIPNPDVPNPVPVEISNVIVSTPVAPDTGSNFVTSSNNANFANITTTAITPNISVVKTDIPVIKIEQVSPTSSRKIFDSDIPNPLSDNLRKALPKDDTLTDRQLQNMSHEEVVSWYKRKHKKK